MTISAIHGFNYFHPSLRFTIWFTVYPYIYICILFEYIHISYIYIHVYIYIDISHVLDRRRAIDQLGASWSNSTVVDVGAGTGVLSVMCGKRTKKVMGNDGKWR